MRLMMPRVQLLTTTDFVVSYVKNFEAQPSILEPERRNDDKKSDNFAALNLSMFMRVETANGSAALLTCTCAYWMS